MTFAKTCWDRAAKGIAEDARETLPGPAMDAEVYMACEITRLSFTFKDGGMVKATPAFLAALAELEKAFGLSREVRSEPDASGDFNFILSKGGTYAARVTPEKLFCEPRACGLDLGTRLLELYERFRGR